MKSTSLNPRCSNRLMMSPTSPRWTPSGFTMMKVRSVLDMVWVEEEEEEELTIQITILNKLKLLNYKLPPC